MILEGACDTFLDIKTEFSVGVVTDDPSPFSDINSILSKHTSALSSNSNHHPDLLLRLAFHQTMAFVGTISVFLLFALFAINTEAHPLVRRGYKSGCQRAFETCDFKFKGIRGLPIFNIDVKADQAFTPRIISTAPGETLGVLNQNGIVSEFIFDNGSFAPITFFGKQPFTPTHFKPFSIPYTTGSGVGHEVFQSNQLEVAKGRCVRIFFTQYQKLIPGTNTVMDNVNNVPRKLNKCVVFRTAA